MTTRGSITAEEEEKRETAPGAWAQPRERHVKLGSFFSLSRISFFFFYWAIFRTVNRFLWAFKTRRIMFCFDFNYPSPTEKWSYLPIERTRISWFHYILPVYRNILFLFRIIKNRILLKQCKTGFLIRPETLARPDVFSCVNRKEFKRLQQSVQREKNNVKAPHR